MSPGSAATPGRVTAALRTLAITSVAVAVTACGFHLQGAAQLPEGVHSVRVLASDELTPFAVALKQTLQRSGATLAASSASADAVVRVTRDRSGRRVLSVSARNTPQEYEVFYAVEYSIDRAGKEVVPSQSMELTRNFSFEESQQLAKDREEDVLREAMAQDLAKLVARRLESL